MSAHKRIEEIVGSWGKGGKVKRDTTLAEAFKKRKQLKHNDYRALLKSVKTEFPAVRRISASDLTPSGSLHSFGALADHIATVSREDRVYRVIDAWAGIATDPGELQLLSDVWLMNPAHAGVPAAYQALIGSLQDEFSELSLPLKISDFGPKGAFKTVYDLVRYVVTRP